MSAVIFDLDGTLIDSAPDIHASANVMLGQIGAEPLEYGAVKSFIGNGVPVLIDRIIAARALPQPHADLEALFLAHYNAHSADLTVLYPQVYEVLSALHRAGFALGVCTNKPEAPTRAILQAFDLTQFFSAVIGGDTLAVKKPDPAPLYRATTQLGRQHAVYVGDSEVDAQTATRASLPFALFTEGYRKSPVADLRHDAAFADFAELPAIIDRLLS